MNRLISLLLTFSLLLALCGCGTDTTDNVPSPPVENLPTEEHVTEPKTEEPEMEPDTVPTPDDPVLPDVTEEPDVPSEPTTDEEVEEYVRTVDPYAPMVALTFDDGPHEIFSDQILDVLEANHSVATFFEVGYNARRYPDVLVRMAELGCEIANHSNAHHDLTTLSKDALLTDLAKLDKIVYEATGFTPTLVRPPYGAVNRTVKTETGRAMITWTVDTKDWMYRDATALIDYIQNYGDLDGEIVLMHSIHGSTAEAMETVVPWLIEQGYQLVTVSELMAYYYGELLEPNKFYNQTYFARHDRTEYPIELPDEPMQTLIPEYNTVPVVPIVPEAEPEVPPTEPAPGTTPPEESPTPDTEDTIQQPTDPIQPEEGTPDAGDGSPAEDKSPGTPDAGEGTDSTPSPEDAPPEEDVGSEPPAEEIPPEETPG